jgi:hypothetical protein
MPLSAPFKAAMKNILVWHVLAPSRVASKLCETERNFPNFAIAFLLRYVFNLLWSVLAAYTHVGISCGWWTYCFEGDAYAKQSRTVVFTARRGFFCRLAGFVAVGIFGGEPGWVGESL